LIAILIVGPPIYFGFAMDLNNPFNFPKDENSTTILNDFIFANNRGLALFILVLIGVILALYDNLKKPFTHRLKSFESNSTKFKSFIDRIEPPAIVREYSSV
jgi:hypothetical protein